MNINFEEDKLIIDGKELRFPCTTEDAQEVIGKGRLITKEFREGDTVHVTHYIAWDELGILACSECDKECFKEITIILKSYSVFDETDSRNLTGRFQGTIDICGKPYKKAKWKKDDIFDHEQVCRVGTYELCAGSESIGYNYEFDGIRFKAKTDETDYMICSYKEADNNQEIEKLKALKNKYRLEPYGEETVSIKNFNFKLLVIEELMYTKSLLTPKFDVYEFALVKDFDVESEGYDVIPSVVNWFKKLEIPKKFADEITELVFDGGNTIYSQIYPFWDGEDDVFDIKRIPSSDFEALPNLKKFVTTTLLNENVRKKFVENGIELKLSKLTE